MSAKGAQGSSSSSSQTFRIMAPTKSASTTLLARFVGTHLPADLTAQNASKGHDQWSMKEQRMTEGGPVVNYVLDKNSLAEDLSDRAQYKGAPEGTMTGADKPSNYFILVKEKADFVAVPVDKWVTFRYSTVNRKFDAQTLEEAEAAMKYRRTEAEKQDVVSLAKLGDLEKQDGATKNGKDGGKGSGKKGSKAKKDADAASKKDNRDEPDSEDEWKDVKAEKLKKRSLMMEADDGLGTVRQATALDFKDGYKPKGAEDWEHEIAADDDDLDMGDDEMMEDGMEDGGFRGKRYMPSPSVSGDDGAMDGDLSDGGMGDTSLRRKLQQTLKKLNKKDLSSDGDDVDDDDDGDDDDDDDDDVEALDAMASGDFLGNQSEARPPKEDEKETKESKKRKGEEKKPAAAGVAEKKPKLKSSSAAAKAAKKPAKAEATGVPSEEEIRSLLAKKQRMLLGEMAREFKKRLNGPEEMKQFTKRVKAVAMFEPGSTKKHLVLKK